MKKVEIVILIGLPGSGKTTYIKNVLNKDKKYKVFDDFYSNAHESMIKTRGHIRSSRYYSELMKILSTGGKCIISDIIFCQSKKLNELKDFINKESRLGFDLKTFCFENNFEECKKNVIRRGVNKIHNELKFIEDNENQYSQNNADKVLNVYKQT